MTAPLAGAGRSRWNFPATRRATLALAGWVAAAALSGCATYTARYATLRDDLASGDFDRALATLEKNASDRDRLLNLLERGAFLHYADRWSESNAAFQAAEEVAADLYTKSISQGALSLLTSDESIDYRGEAFELAMVPYYRALNYIYLGERAEAVVEARKASLLLRQHAEHDLGALGALDPERDTSPDEILKNDAFLHYFAALVYEWGGDVNDAFIAFRHAADAYHDAAGALALSTPPWLSDDLRRTGAALGFADELARLPAAFPAVFATDADSVAGGAFAAPGAGRGEVVLLLELGFVPQKHQNELNVPVLKTDRRDDRIVWARDLRGRLRPGWSAGEQKIEYWLRVAVPELVSSRPSLRGARVTAVDAGVHANALPIEDLEGRALAAFKAREGTIWLKTIARGLAKYGVKQAADQKGWLAGAMANVLGAATEKADTRAWLTLPNRICMARLRLPPGRHDLRVALLDDRGLVLREETIAGVAVKSGDRVFLSRRVF